MKKALLVGINDYKYPIPKLRGCLNDVHTMWFILTQIFNFHPDNIRVLCDERATFDNIHDELIWLLKDGEELVFHFSGHGSQTRDLNQDESDGLEELIVVYDHSWDKPFVDDHLAAIFKNLKPEQNLTVLLDCCHSGSGTRMSNIQTVDRYLEPPLDIQYGWALVLSLGILIGYLIFKPNSSIIYKIENKLKDEESKMKIELAKIRAKSEEKKKRLESLKQMRNVKQRLEKLAELMNEEF